MCELITVKSNETIPIEWIFHYAKLFEEYGFAGFGWGVAWKDKNGKIRRYRSEDGVRNDSLAPKTLKGIHSTEYLVHLRKPSKMKTIAYTNAQPYINKDEMLSFAHNGYFTNYRNYHSNFLQSLEGTSDSEIGFQYLLMKQKEPISLQKALQETHQDLGGRANMIVFSKDEETVLYAGNEDNWMYRFTLEGIQCASTSLHSLDDYLFHAIFPTASDIQEIPLFTSCKLTENNNQKACSIK